MRKIVSVVGVLAVLGIGGGVVINNLLRTGDQLGRVGSELSPQGGRSAPAPTPSVSRPAAPIQTGPAAVVAADASEPTAEEQFGHDAHEQLQADQTTTMPDSPQSEATGDATSLAPLLSDTRARLEGLLADAEPAAVDELATLLGARAPIEALLDNPDPAVREEAAALLQLLARPAP
jgi:hypothetical protein